MDSAYADTVRLLLAIAPEVFANDIFTMNGGTAINLIVQNMPRLSVDIDVVYLPWQVPRDEALREINEELAAIAERVTPLRVQTRLIRSKDLGDTKLVVETETSQVKVEVNVVFTADMVECFVVYLAGHNRPPHEVLFGHDKDIAGEYERAFVGMTEVDCSLETLLDARARLRHELPRRLSPGHKQFLNGLVRAQPDWSLLRCRHAAQLPALRWKLANLETFRKRRPQDFAAQADALDASLSQV